MRLAIFVLFIAFVIGPAYIRTSPTPAALDKNKLSSASSAKNIKVAEPTPIPTPLLAAEKWRGWNYVASRLLANGVAKETVRKIYTDKRLPRRTFVPFAVKPKEPSSMYRSFLQNKFSKLGSTFIKENARAFGTVEQEYKVPKEIVASIIVIESQAGKNTGKHPILYRLSRIATTNAPDNLKQNYTEARKKDPSVTFEQVAARGLYLEQTFLPEIIALLEIAERNDIDPLAMKGSRAGAFGLPQFLPTTYLRFGTDGDKDGRVSLYNEADAVLSAAHFLSHHGLRADTPMEQKRTILWNYNKSDSYIDTVLRLSEDIKRSMRRNNQSKR